MQRCRCFLVLEQRLPETSLCLRSGDGSLLLGWFWDTCIIDFRDFGHLEKCQQGCAMICHVEKGDMRGFLKVDGEENIPFDQQSIFRAAGHRIGSLPHRGLEMDVSCWAGFGVHAS